jgi:hypothetical protein
VSDTAKATAIRESERWFGHHGLPQFMPDYARKEAIRHALPLLLVIAAFALTALPLLELRTPDAFVAAPLLITFALLFVPVVSFLLKGRGAKLPRPRNAIAWLVAFALVCLGLNFTQLPPGESAIWLDAGFVLAMFVVATRMLTRRGGAGALGKPAWLHWLLFAVLLLGATVYAIDGTPLMPGGVREIAQGTWLSGLFDTWDPYPPASAAAMVFALAAVAATFFLGTEGGAEIKYRRLIAAVPPLALVCTAEVGQIPQYSLLRLGVDSRLAIVLVVLALCAPLALAPLGGRLRRWWATPHARGKLRALGLLAALIILVAVGHSFAFWLLKGEDNGAAVEMLLLDVALGALVGLVLFLGLNRVAAWAMNEALDRISVILIAIVRGLPVLLIFLAFFGIVEEIWKIAEADDASREFLVMSGFLLIVTFLYLLLDANQQLSEHRREFRHWEQVRSCIAGDDTPKGIRALIPKTGLLPELKLTRAQHVNGLAVVLVYETLIFIPIAAATFLIFLGLGYLVVDPALFWDGAAADNHRTKWLENLFAEEPWTLVALLMSSFSVLYLAVHVTARDQRELFLAATGRALRRSLAMLIAYRYINPPAEPTPVPHPARVASQDPVPGTTTAPVAATTAMRGPGAPGPPRA